MKSWARPGNDATHCSHALRIINLLEQVVMKIYMSLQGTIPPGEMPDRFQVHAETIDGGDNDENKLSYCTHDIPVTPDSDGMVFIQLNASTPTCTHSSSILKAYRKYNATIATKNYFGETNSTGEILFSKLYVICILDSYLIAEASCGEVSVHLYNSILMYNEIWVPFMNDMQPCMLHSSL